MLIAALRRAKVRREIKSLRDRFRAEPGIRLVAAYAHQAQTESEKRFVAQHIREGCLGALDDLGVNGPWGRDRREVAVQALHSLLADVLPADVLGMVMEGQP